MKKGQGQLLESMEKTIRGGWPLSPGLNCTRGAREREERVYKGGGWTECVRGGVGNTA